MADFRRTGTFGRGATDLHRRVVPRLDEFEHHDSAQKVLPAMTRGSFFLVRRKTCYPIGRLVFEK